MAPRILVIVPHPDDETYSFGGTIAFAARSGAHIIAITVSRGELGERHGNGLFVEVCGSGEGGTRIIAAKNPAPKARRGGRRAQGPRPVD